MLEFLETTQGKFTFKVAVDRYYNDEGVWARSQGDQIRIGLSDFLQQRSGDIAFVEIQTVGTQLPFEEEVATIETIKVNISLSSPVAGMVAEINPAVLKKPELINQDPYGEGWLALIEPSDWKADSTHLLNAHSYLELIKKQIEEEVS
jgi:glycine cleavage system H protein